MSKWWLISDGTVRVVKQALWALAHEGNDSNCPDWRSLSPRACRACDGDELRRKGQYAFDAGLHKTDVVPTDFQNEKGD